MNSEIDERIEAFVTKSAIPQLDIGIWHGGEIHEGSYGIDKLATVDVFEIGSVGKTFTATLLAALAEEKQVNLSDTLHSYRPDLAFAGDITLLQLATHTAGLPNNPFKGIVLNADRAMYNWNPADYDEYLAGIRKPLKTGRFRYSNLGMSLLGNVLGEHVGMSYENAVKHYILEPLGMKDTHVSPAAYDTKRVAIGHSAKGKAVPHFHWSRMEPAGLWRSTIEDMMVYLKAHLGYSGELWENLLEKTTLPALDDPKKDYVGLAWLLSRNKVFGDFVWHNGQTLGQKSVAVCAKASGSAVVILSNKIPKIWQPLFPSYSIEKLSFDILESLERERKVS